MLGTGAVAIAVAVGSVAAQTSAVEPPATEVTADVVAVEAVSVTRPLTGVAVVANNQAEHHGHSDVVADPEPAPAKVKPAKANPEAEKKQAAATADRPPPGGPSPSGALGIPERAMSAYRVAAAAYGARCNLGWEVIAAIGRAESGHANGGQLYPDGLTWTPILGPVLNGSGFAAIRDSDGGRLDGDDTWDRAVGPMQFIPGTWAWIGVDGDGDGRSDPNDIDDAAAGAARYLCSHGGDLSDRAQLRSAILRYNNSGAYADAVLAWADGYAGRATVLPDPPSPPKPKKEPNETDAKQPPTATNDREPAAATPTPKPAPTPTPPPTSTPTPSAPAPSPTPTEPPPTPTPSPTPTPTPTPSPTATQPPDPPEPAEVEPTASPTSVADPDPSPTP